MTPRGRITLALVALLAGSGCVPVRPTPTDPPAASAATEWPSVHARVMRHLRESHVDSADRALSEFAQRFAGSPEAAEVPYWRAVVRLDPASSTSLHESMATLDAYLANTPSGLHRTEATLLRRLGQTLDQRNAALAAVPATPAVRPDDKAREEELQHLRDDLAKANAELARIRRRLARPRS